MAKTCIAVDSGKHMTKAVMAVNKDDPSKDKVLSFRTSVSEHTKDIGMRCYSNIFIRTPYLN